MDFTHDYLILTTAKSTFLSEKEKLERSAGFVLYRVGEDGKCYYLLLRHVGGHWGFPKGKVELGENEQVTARRETREETGIKQFRPVPGFRRVSSYHFRRAGKLVEKQVVYFLANTDIHNFDLSREHTACGWYNYPAAQRVLTYPESREILRGADEFIHRIKNAWK